MKKEFLVAVGFSAIFTALLFYKFFLFGLLPMPADALVKAYYPWKYGGWQGYDPLSTYKEVIATDVFRQQLPWIKLTVEQIKKGQWPLWNPYNFSGYPLLANMQSHVFYPLNIVFFVIPLIPAWVIFVLIQPFLSCLFMYMFLRSIKLTKAAALFGGMGFMFSSFLITWLEWGFIAQGAMYLPLFLWLIEKVSNGKRKMMVLLPLLIYTLITSGYVQVITYVLVVSMIYFVFCLMTMVKDTKERLVLLSHTAAMTVIGVLLTAIQLLPTIEVYRQSTRQIGIEDFFKRYLLPWQSFITIFSHDFFGNFATRNLWADQYSEFMMFFGVVAAVLAAVAIMVRWQQSLSVKFFALLAFFSLLFALSSPFSYLILMTRLPVLSSGIPSRTLFIFQFSMVVLAAFGLEVVMSRRHSWWPKIKQAIFIFSLIYAFLWLLTFFLPQVFAGSIIEQSIARRNLVLPSGVFLLLGFALGIFFRSKKKLASRAIIFVIFGLVLIEYLYFSNKFLPFAPRKYIYPTHSLIEYLRNNGGYNRIWNFNQEKNEPYLDSNFSTYFKLFSPEGFDSLSIRRYAELVTAASGGHKENLGMRSDVKIPLKDNFYQQKLLNLLAVKYLPWVVENEANAEYEDSHRFPKDRFELMWHQGRFQLYRNRQVLPRAFLVDKYLKLDNDDDILKTLYNEKFDLATTIILEEELPASFNLIDKTIDGEVEIVNYEPNKVEIAVKTPANQILFLSDSFFPGWKAYLDGQPTKIYRADYAFRAVFVPKNSQKVIFKYEPQSFRTGLVISLFALACYFFYLTKSFIIKTR